MLPSPRISLSELRCRLKQDHERLIMMSVKSSLGRRQFLYFHTSFQAVFWFRLANYFHSSNLGFLGRFLGRLLWHFNLIWTGADISEHADIQGGFVVLHPVGVAVMGTAGKNLTLGACAGIGGEIGREEDIGAGPGFCKLGDNVTIEPHSGVLGPVEIGDNVTIGATIVITENIESNTKLESPNIRTFTQRKKNANKE